MKFGIKTGQGLSGYTYDELSSIWRKSDELGFESAWLHDHFLSSTNSESDPTLEAYATLAALARDTKRLRFGVMVTCAGYRNPAYLAKVGATIDSISRGRFIMGIGAGWFEKEFTSYGYRFPSVPERVEQLGEALKILRLMWTEESPSFSGKQFSINEAQCYPRPVQKTIPIWVGINAGRRTLPRMAVELADGFNATANLEACGAMIARAEGVRTRRGRPRSEVTYSTQPQILVGDEAEVERIVNYEAGRWRMSTQEYTNKLRNDGCIIGSAESCAQELRRYGEIGVDYLIPIIVGDRLIWPLETVRDELLPLL